MRGVAWRFAGLFAATTLNALAGTVLVYEDSVRGTSAVPGGITLAGDTAVMATSESSFISDLESGGWTAVIFGIEGCGVPTCYSNPLGDVTALQNYVAGGGNLIAATWFGSSLSGTFNPTPGSVVAGPNILPLMDASDPVDIDTSPMVNDSSFIFAGVSGNVGITSGPYGVYNQTYTPLAGGTGYSPVGDGSFDVIVGHNGHTILDGPLFPAFSNLSQGQQIIANELESFSTTPEPASTALVGSGLIAVVLTARKRRRL